MEELLKERERLEKVVETYRNEILRQMAQHQQLMQSFHQLSQKNPLTYVPQDACLYPMSGSMSQAPPRCYNDPGIQGAIVGATNSSVCGLFRDHNIGGAQRAEVMVPQDQMCNDIVSLSLRTMVVEEHKPPVPHGI